MKPRICKRNGAWFLYAEMTGYLDPGPFMASTATWPEALELLRALYRRKRIHRKLT